MQEDSEDEGAKPYYIALFVCVFNANPSCRNVDRVCSLVIPSCTNEFWSHGNFYLREVAIYS
jgi:hypothetical protein